MQLDAPSVEVSPEPEVLEMAIDDYLESEVGIAVAATAALLSPRARHALRRGLVFGVAGALSAGEALASTSRRLGGAARNIASSDQTESSNGGTTEVRRTARSTKAAT